MFNNNNESWADAAGEMDFNMAALPQIEDFALEDEDTAETDKNNAFLNNIATVGPFKVIVEIKGNLSNKIEKSFLQNQISNHFSIDAKVEYRSQDHHFTLIFDARDGCVQAQKLSGKTIDRNSLKLYVSRSDQQMFLRKLNTATKSNTSINRFQRHQPGRNSSQDGRQTQDGRNQDGRMKYGGQRGTQNTRYQRRHNFPVGGSIRKNRRKNQSTRTIQTKVQTNNSRRDAWKKSSPSKDSFRESSTSRISRQKADPTRDPRQQRPAETRFGRAGPRRDRQQRTERRSRDDQTSDGSSSRSFGRFGRDTEKDTRPRDLNRNEGRADMASSWRRGPAPERSERKPRRARPAVTAGEDGFSVSNKKTINRNRTVQKKKEAEVKPVKKHMNAFAAFDDDSD